MEHERTYSRKYPSLLWFCTYISLPRENDVFNDAFGFQVLLNPGVKGSFQETREGNGLERIFKY